MPRIGGILYLLIIAARLFAEFVRERFIVPGNAAATASNITDHAYPFRRLQHCHDVFRLFVRRPGLSQFYFCRISKALGVLLAIAGVSQHCTAPLSPTGFDAVPVNPRAGIDR
jgi:Domain of unknown function (DUF4386)